MVDSRRIDAMLANINFYTERMHAFVCTYARVHLHRSIRLYYNIYTYTCSRVDSRLLRVELNNCFTLFHTTDGEMLLLVSRLFVHKLFLWTLSCFSAFKSPVVCICCEPMDEYTILESESEENRAASLNIASGPSKPLQSFMTAYWLLVVLLTIINC